MQMSDEVRMIGETVAGLSRDAPDPATLWAQLAELGMLGLAVEVGAGGAGLGMAELAEAARALGREPQPVPFLASEVLTLPLLSGLAGLTPVAEVIRTACSGGGHVALAERDIGLTGAVAVDGGYRIDGRKGPVLSAQGAEHYLVSALLDGGSALFLISGGTPGLTVVPYVATGLGPAGDLVLDAVTVSTDALLLKGDAATSALSAAQARAMLAVAAEIAGALDEMLALTIDYLRTRQQFGVPLASFQALQHAAVGMYVELELLRSMIDFGVLMSDAPPAERDLAMAAVKLKANTTARLVGEAAVQLHGGIGMTQEAKVGRLFARTSALRLLAGDDALCRAELDQSDIGLQGE